MELICEPRHVEEGKISCPVSWEDIELLKSKVATCCRYAYSPENFDILVGGPCPTCCQVMVGDLISVSKIGSSDIEMFGVSSSWSLEKISGIIGIELFSPLPENFSSTIVTDRFIVDVQKGPYRDHPILTVNDYEGLDKILSLGHQTIGIIELATDLKHYLLSTLLPTSECWIWAMRRAMMTSNMRVLKYYCDYEYPESDFVTVVSLSSNKVISWAMDTWHISAAFDLLKLIVDKIDIKFLSGNQKIMEGILSTYCAFKGNLKTLKALGKLVQINSDTFLAQLLASENEEIILWGIDNGLVFEYKHHLMTYKN
jgi:hypothetical protein